MEGPGDEGPARRFYEWAEIGTPVQIHGEWDLSDPSAPENLECRRFSPERGFYLEEDAERPPVKLVSLTSGKETDSQRY